MVKAHSAIVRLNELKALEQVTQRIDKISVFNGLDGLLNDFVKLRSSWSLRR